MSQGRPYLDDQREPPALPKSAKLRAAAATSVTEKLHLAGLLPAIQAICISAGLQVTEVVERGASGQLSRIKAISQCRGRILAEVRKLRGWSYPHIGNLFGLDHTSVMMAVRKVEQGWGKAEGLIGNSWREPGVGLESTGSEPAVNLEPVSRALASRASEASLCSSSLAESIPIVAVSDQTRERGTAPQQSGASQEIRDMAARIASHAELSALNALAIASKFEGWRMARGKPAVADVLTAIDEYVLTVAGNQAIPANELQRGLVSYMRNARPPKAETTPTRPASSWREQQASAGPGIDYAELKQERVAPALPSGDVLARLEALGHGKASVDRQAARAGNSLGHRGGADQGRAPDSGPVPVGVAGAAGHPDDAGCGTATAETAQSEAVEALGARRMVPRRTEDDDESSANGQHDGAAVHRNADGRRPTVGGEGSAERGQGPPSHDGGARGGEGHAGANDLHGREPAADGGHAAPVAQLSKAERLEFIKRVAKGE